MGFFERLLMGGRHHGQGGGHHGGGHRRGQGGYSPAPVVAGMACPACRTANAATARFYQGCGGALASLRCIACNADLAAGTKFYGACGTPQQQPQSTARISTTRGESFAPVSSPGCLPIGL